MNQFFLYENTKNEFITDATTNYFRDKELSYKTYQNVYALPSKNVWQDGKKVRWGGLVEESGNYIMESGRFRNEEHTLTDNTMVGGYKFNKVFCSRVKSPAIYCGEFLEHWGHFLLESTTRLWYVVQHRQPGQKLVFVARKGLKLNGNFKNFFELLGISPKDVLLIKRPTKIDSIIVPEASSALDNYYTKEFTIPFTQLKQNVWHQETKGTPLQSPKRIYLSRRKCKIRLIMGEENLENIFKQNGFTIIYPERCPLKQLVSLLQSAEYLAGISGSAMHNALFCSQNTKLIVLNRNPGFNHVQGLINQAMNLDTIFTDVHFNFLPTQEFYLLGITSLFQEMCQKLGFSISKVILPSPKEVQLFFKYWIKELPRMSDVIKKTNFLNSSEVAYSLFSQMTTESWFHQKMDLLKYTILSQISWGAYKKKYQTKLKHYQEKYGLTLTGQLLPQTDKSDNPTP